MVFKKIFLIIFSFILVSVVFLPTKVLSVSCSGSFSYQTGTCNNVWDRTEKKLVGTCGTKSSSASCQDFGGFCEAHYTYQNCVMNSNGTCKLVAGSGSNIESCEEVCYPVTGGWSAWSSCSNCRMTRTCTNPAPSCGGATCVGPSTQSCGFTNGVCGSSLNTCSWGTVSGITTESFSVGINNVWYCNGLCGGTTAKCTSLLCTSVDGISTMCTGDRLCVNGITASNVTDDGIDYIWDCIGTAGTCNGTDGSSQTGCRYAIAQDSWFQTINGGIAAKSLIKNYISRSCSLTPTTCTSAMSIRGFVSAPTIENYSNILYSSPDNWYTNQNLTTKINFFEKYKEISGVGTSLIEGDLIDSNIITNTNGLLMVDGNVTISQNKTTSLGNFFMIVASGNITINPSVNKFDGMLIGNNIDIGGTSNEPLTINGSLYGTNLVKITRSFTNKMDNNDSPAVVVSYRPDFIFNTPSSMAKNVTEWRWGN